ncbi:MAG: DUF4349 domain-containing protein [Methanoregula sp.]|nr:DUF4349 domain-containing protein [Methanoregula sp.]
MREYVSMQKRVVGILILCIAFIAAMGWLGLSAAGVFSGASPRETAQTGWGGIPVPTIYHSTENAVALGHSFMVRDGSDPGGSDTKIIRTADVTLEVKEVPAAVESITSLAKSSGGFVASTSIQSGYSNRLSGSIEVRVPAASFESSLTGIKASGKVRSVSTRGQDVTEEYVDLVAQQTSYQNQLAQYNAILKQSQKVEDIIAVQEQIDRVQTELDRLASRLKYLNGKIDYSTISVNLQEPEPVGGETGHSFLSTINNGIAGFFGMIDLIIVVLFSLLPLIIFGGAVYGIYRWRRGKTVGDIKAEPEKR